VIAFGCGSVPEIIEDGLTGFSVDSVDAAVAAVPRARQLDRREIRRCFEQRFTAERMARDYLRVYDQVLTAHGFDAGAAGREAEDAD
jgi:glycosyltransferase involved in cell wall biosynthesis